MSVFDDPRVKASVGVSDEAWEVHKEEGVYDVVQDDDGQWVLAPPRQPGDFNPSDREGYLAWFASLPRFASSGEAVASALEA